MKYGGVEQFKGEAIILVRLLSSALTSGEIHSIYRHIEGLGSDIHYQSLE